MVRIWDIIVVGGGHAGCEAALAAARVGCEVLLVTGNLEMIGAMACNCSIGGPAKAHLVREIDALGGEMGRCIDRTFTHMRMLNTTKGPAVQALRAQADKALYRQTMKSTLEQAAGVHVLQETAVALRAPDRPDRGMVLETQEGERLRARRVVVATGTFLNGLVHIGRASYSAGRAGEPASTHLAESLQALGLAMGRLKTGTVPRVALRTLDVDKLVETPSDARDLRFAMDRVPRPGIPLLSCWRTSTTGRTMQIVGDALGESALGSGRIQGIGPRYCPSIEAKLLRFPDREEHGVFLEREGWGTDEVYVQGVSNSLPVEVQRAMVASITGLERAVVVRPGYAIEYDYVDPRSLTPELSCRDIPGLYLAGQINGTSGYEEAAAQGLLAGANAALSLLGEQPLVLDRRNAYIGVLVDDVVHHHAAEPYRLLTSRAEHRLRLGQNTAHARLTETAWAHRLVPGARLEAVQRAMESVRAGRVGRKCNVLARRIAEDEAVYEGYRRGDSGAEQRDRDWESVRIPPGFDFRLLPVKLEVRARLREVRPQTLSEAMNIPGITKADVATLVTFLRRRTGSVSRETLTSEECNGND